MSFLIRHISHAADGREIVRTATVAGERIVIGRASESDVHLADLAVEARHAQVEQVAPGRIVVTLIDGVGFDLEGRSVARAEIDADHGGELRIGSHRISIGRDGDAVSLSVARVAEAARSRDEATLFTLRGLLPGKRISAWGYALLVLAAFLAWPIYSFATYQGVKERPAGFHADQSWSSGKLSLAHARLENDCQACHQQPFVAVRDDSCIACHDDAHQHAPAARLAAARAEPDLAGKARLMVAGAFNRPQGRCVECHIEHEGAKAMPPTPQRFCADCHDGLDKRLTDTAILNASDFGTDHPQFRPAVLVRPGGPHPLVRRVSLDARPVENNGLKFPHALHLSKTNGVARMAQTMMQEQGFGQSLVCKDCHVPDATGTRFQPVAMEKDCAMCHSLAYDEVGGTIRTLRHGQPAQVIADLRAYYRSSEPARPINLGGMARRRPGDAPAARTVADYAAAASFRPSRADEAIRAVFSKGGACYDCHSVDVPNHGSSDFRIRPVIQLGRFMGKGWFSHDAHRTESCESCHAAPKSDSANDLLLPGIATCRECHGGESARADVPSSCAMCHDYHADEGAPWLARQRAARDKGRRNHPAGRRDEGSGVRGK